MRRCRECRPRSRAGLSLVEMLVVLLIGGMIVGAAVNMLAANNQLFLSQRSVLGTHNTIRAATAPLVWELREASAKGGDLYAIDTTSFALRSRIATGVVCKSDSPNGRYGLTGMAGEYGSGSADSALVYIIASAAWKRIAVAQIGNPASLGSPTACAYPGGPTPQVAVRLSPATAADTAGIVPGAPVVLFRRVDYSLIQESGSSWLKRKVGSGSWETVAGPLASNGLRFSYFDSVGGATANPSLVSSVGILVLPETPRGPRIAPDTIRLRALLRN